MTHEIVPEGHAFDQILQGPECDLLRSWVQRMVHEAMEAEVSALVGAERYQRSSDRTTHRNGYRERAWETRVGDVTLQIPKLRNGSYFPSFLEPRRRAERALVSVVQEAFVSGISTPARSASVRAASGKEPPSSCIKKVSASPDAWQPKQWKNWRCGWT